MNIYVTNELIASCVHLNHFKLLYSNLKVKTKEIQNQRDVDTAMKQLRYGKFTHSVRRLIFQ